MCVARCWSALALLLLCLEGAAGAEPGDYPPVVAPRAGRSTQDGSDWMSLPRLERLWQRDGVGLYQGIVVGRSYCTVTNDKTELVALDPATGYELWRSALPKPVFGHPHLALVGSAIVVGSEGQTHDEFNLVSASTSGKVGWSSVHLCKRAEIENPGQRLFLRCHEHAPYRGSTRLVEIDMADGSEGSRFSIASELEPMPTGLFCSSEARQVSCFDLVGDALKQRWAVPASGAGRYSRLQGMAAFVVRSDETSVDVFRTNDGRRLFHRDASREHDRWIERDLDVDRLFLFGLNGLEILRMPDGHRVAKLPWPRDRGHRLLPGDRRSVMVLRPGEPQAGLIDRNGKLERVELPPVEALTLAGDVVLAHGVLPPRYHRRDGSLSAYSLSRLAPPAASLPANDRVVAVLAHYADPYWAFEVIAALREIPGGLDILEKIIRQDRGYGRITAIAVAGASGLLRFLPVLHDALRQTASPPTTEEERTRLLEIVHALASIDSPEAAGILLAYWRDAEPLLVEPNLRAFLVDTIDYMVWRYSGERDWAACPERAFPTGEREPGKAVLGTASPGEGDVLDREGRWALLCQARNDDDKNGRLSVEYLMHGGTAGDRLRPYLVLGSGEGREVDDFLVAQPSGLHAVVTARTCVYLVDTQTGRARALPRADGRVRIGPGRDAPVIAFSHDGLWLAYLRSNGRQVRVVLREMLTGVEREIDPGGDSVLSLYFDNPSSALVMYVADFEGDDLRAKPWATTESDIRHCRGGGARVEAFAAGPAGPTYRVRQVSVQGGPVQDVDHPSRVEAAPVYPPRYQLLPAVPGTVEAPVGPFRWQK